MALRQLHVEPGTMMVSGIDKLISGLSGKFISSVVALFCAILFSIIEKWLIHWLEVEHQNFLHNVEKVFSVQTPQKLLSKLEKHLSDQSLAFRHFSTDRTISREEYLARKERLLHEKADIKESLSKVSSGVSFGHPGGREPCKQFFGTLFQANSTASSNNPAEIAAYLKTRAPTTKWLVANRSQNLKWSGLLAL